jgi:hypothetical protein
VIATAVFLFVVTDWLFAEGMSLTAVTLMFTVEMFESLLPSLTLNVKLSEPLKLCAGAYVKDGPVPDSVPCAG